MSTYAIQRSVEITDTADTADDGAAAMRATAAAMTEAGQPVRILHCTYIPAERICLCIVEADDAATVIEALRSAGVTAARVLPARVL